jgi:hypothetical protein
MTYTREYVKENAAALALVCACLALPQPAAAQQDFLTFRQQMRPTPPGRSHLHRRSDAQMGVIADRVDYDYIDHQFAVVAAARLHHSCRRRGGLAAWGACEAFHRRTQRHH